MAELRLRARSTLELMLTCCKLFALSVFMMPGIRPRDDDLGKRSMQRNWSYDSRFCYNGVASSLAAVTPALVFILLALSALFACPDVSSDRREGAVRLSETLTVQN